MSELPKTHSSGAEYSCDGKPLKILTVANVPPDPNSGAAGTVFHTNAAFRSLGHEVTEVWADQLGPRRIEHGNLHSLLEQPRAYRREVARAVKKDEFDVVMISQPQGYLAAKMLKKAGFRGIVVNRSHGLELRADSVLPHWHRELRVPESRRPLLTSLVKPLLQRQWTQAIRWFDGIVLPSHDDRKFLLKRTDCHSEQMATIHHGIPDTFLSADVAPMTEKRNRKLLYVGQYAFIKGPDILIGVLNTLLQQESSVTLTWVTSRSHHHDISSQLNPQISDRVHLCEWVAQSELLPLLDAHGVFIFPSLFEGAGKACAEAISRGLHVVASETGGMKDHLAKVYPQGLCEVGNVEQFAKVIKRCVNACDDFDSARQQMVNYAKKLTWNSCAEKLIDFYRYQLHRKSSV